MIECRPVDKKPIITLKERYMGIMDFIKGLLGRAGGTVAENIKERLSDAAGEHIPEGLSDAKEGMDEIMPDEKQ